MGMTRTAVRFSVNRDDTNGEILMIEIGSEDVYDQKLGQDSVYEEDGWEFSSLSSEDQATVTAFVESMAKLFDAEYPIAED